MTALDLLRSAALAAAARGWPVFPLRPQGKTPALRRWQHYATTEMDHIHRWWSYNPRFNVAVVTGEPSGLHVIDLDPSHFPHPATDLDVALEQLAACLGEPAPLTFTVATPAGWHLYYRAPTELSLPCTIGRLGAGIDSRGCGGYIVAPGSRTPLGTYRVTDPRPISNLSPPLVTALTPAQLPATLSSAVAPTHPDSYLAAILRCEADRVARARPGLRNITVFRSALVLGRLVAAHELTEHHARSVLLDAARGHIGVEGFTATELDHAITNAFRYTANRPRHIRRNCI
ncbi:bifunctional DNA primase/polymerase [Nocardia transvalensis]|uniref:bifunctional DNA primase/polymerase n=1 Tax=Nocardia transvalensis TaxID=37333 RepID=UPI0018953975|nr:bifunctional DNA primase/polymerase [Nocardia transvalensis]MBF6331887.1 bifunctional DNA primase/polymerase [Nocardia transvalensis]